MDFNQWLRTTLNLLLCRKYLSKAEALHLELAVHSTRRAQILLQVCGSWHTDGLIIPFHLHGKCQAKE